jgi:hypothetical protein
MRSVHRSAVAVCTLVLALLASPAHATCVGIEFGLGFNSMAPDQVNDMLKQVNGDLGTNFGEITGGTGLPLALRVWPNPQLLLRFSLNTMIVESTSSGFGEATYDTSPVAATLTATWFFAQPGHWRFGAGAGLGGYDIAGEVKGLGSHGDLTGSGLGYHGQGEIEWGFGKRWSLCTQVGYRQAKVDDTKLEESSWEPKLVTDFSGVYWNLGFAHDWR